MNSRKIVFLFLQGIHQIYHLAPIAMKLGELQNFFKIQLLSCHPHHTAILKNIEKLFPKTSVEIITLPLPFRFRFLNFKKKTYPSPHDTMRSAKKYMMNSVAIVSTSHITPRLCRKLKIPTLLHMPMEPISYPETDPGPGALLTTMPNNELRNAVKKNLMSLPYIVGVNNHMGSKFTQDSRGMKIFLTELKKRHLFFIDSGTTPKSVAQKLGRELGILVFKRDIFIDNEKDIKTILKFLKKAEKYSLKKGVVIAIGHPYPETIAALKIWKKQKNPQVTLIPVTRLLKKNGLPPGAATHIYSKTKSS
jgi:polysaccharide deacetylase 2 family uncharacterized protein YibQ